jgi:hypothetical protein
VAALPYHIKLGNDKPLRNIDALRRDEHERGTGKHFIQTRRMDCKNFMLKIPFPEPSQSEFVAQTSIAQKN